MPLTKESQESLHNSSSNNEKHEDDKEEALSLCNLPINKDEEFEYMKSSSMRVAKNSQYQDFFEFFNDLKADMCAADDIFVSGKLLPSRSSITKRNNPCRSGSSRLVRSGSVHEMGGFRQECRLTNGSSCLVRSESLHVERASSQECRLTRSCFSVDYRKLDRVAGYNSEKPPLRNSGRVGGGDVSGRKALSQPKWYLLMIGSMRAPVEMEMKDIRNRQRRRNSSPVGMFPPIKMREETDSGKGSSGWKLLRALSCKGHANVVVASSYPRVRQVRNL